MQPSEPTPGLEVAVEVEAITRGAVGTVRVRHRWGTSTLAANDALQVGVVRLPSVRQRYQEMLRQLQNGPAEPGRRLEVAEWALTHGLTGECESVLKDLAQAYPDHPAAVAFGKVQTGLQRFAAREPGELTGPGRPDNRTNRYALDHNLPPERYPEAARRLALLEDNCRRFYYWFALRGQALPVPERPLGAVLLDRPGEFLARNREGRTGPPAAEAFYDIRENLLVFSAVPVDGPVFALRKQFDDLAQPRLDRAELLKGRGPRGAPPQAAAQAQTLALALQAAEEQAERLAVIDAATRQLAVASGLLPRTAPEWALTGLGAAFQTLGAPFGPEVVPPHEADRALLARIPLFAREARPVEPLRLLVTDRPFREATAARNRTDLEKARAQAWALALFLVQKRPEALGRYGQELAKVPRDLGFPEDVPWGCFAKALDLYGMWSPDRPDPERLAEEWAHFIKALPEPAPAGPPGVSGRPGENPFGPPGPTPGPADNPFERPRPTPGPGGPPSLPRPPGGPGPGPSPGGPPPG
jgi:hypothetical protein